MKYLIEYDSLLQCYFITNENNYNKITNKYIEYEYLCCSIKSDNNKINTILFLNAFKPKPDKPTILPLNIFNQIEKYFE